MTIVRTFPDATTLGTALAREIVTGIDHARRAGRSYLLGCPGGRSGRSTYAALARLASGTDLGHLIVVMMDDYLERDVDGGWGRVTAEAHHSCERFARQEIVGAMDARTRATIPDDHVWLPDPRDPGAYEARIADAGGVDLFIVASGASDGHVAFNPPGSALDGGVAIVPLAETTRRDNLATFPDFRSIDEVPTHGVSVGLGTIMRQSRHVRLVIHGGGKRTAAARVLAGEVFDPDWPATFIHRCPDAQIWLDRAAHPGGVEENGPASVRATRSEEVT